MEGYLFPFARSALIKAKQIVQWICEWTQTASKWHCISVGFRWRDDDDHDRRNADIRPTLCRSLEPNEQIKRGNCVHSWNLRRRFGLSLNAALGRKCANDHPRIDFGAVPCRRQKNAFVGGRAVYADAMGIKSIIINSADHIFLAAAHAQHIYSLLI